MRILYIKRAYNTRLHNQVTALLQKGHKVTLLLETPIESGYNGPGQWTPKDLSPKLSIYYTGNVKSQIDSQHKKTFIPQICKDLASYQNRLLKIRGHSDKTKKRTFLRALKRVINMHSMDLIISSNDALVAEDIRTKWVLESWSDKIPIVYECQDILSDCFTEISEVEENERIVNEASDGVIHTNPLALKWICNRYSVKRGVSFQNYASSIYFQSRLPKLSAHDDLIHLVYCGSVQKTPEKYQFPFARDLKNMFREIASLGNPLHLHLGLYPGTPEYNYYMELKSCPNIKIYGYLPFHEMMQKLTRYDIGVFPIDLGSFKEQVELSGPSILEDFPLSRADTSKQYEYTLAGLPVLTAPIKWVSQWLEENNFGTSYNSISHLQNILKTNQFKDYGTTVIREASKFAIEKKISQLENFLLDIAGGGSSLP
jgi:hypothetical protein